MIGARLLVGPAIRCGLGLLVCALLSGCAAVGPDYAPPAASVPAEFVGGAGTTLRDVAGDTWWQGYSDATLNALVARGLVANMDIAQARSRVAASEAALRGTGVASQVDGSLSGQSTRAGGDDTLTMTTNSAIL